MEFLDHRLTSYQSEDEHQAGEDVERASPRTARMLDGEIATLELKADLGHLAIVELGCHARETAHAFAARELGVRIHASRGSMDLGESDGGLPPDSLVEDIDAILAETERLAGLQDEGGLVRLVVAPCSPFSVTRRLMQESAELARRLGLQLLQQRPIGGPMGSAGRIETAGRNATSNVARHT